LLNFYVDLWFFVQAAVAVVLFRITLWVLPNWTRQPILLGVSAYFLSFLANFANFRLPLIAYVAVIVVFGEAIAFANGRYKSVLIGLASTLAVLVLLVYKYAYVAELANIGASYAARLHAIHWVGLSYLTFKAIDYCIAMRSAKMAQEHRSTCWLYACPYLVFFPAFVSGPINRFAPYLSEQIQPPVPMTAVRLRGNVLRASLGVIKILFFAKLARAYSIVGPEFGGSGPLSFASLAIGLYSYYLFIYFDFSGYCDVAIALADFFEVRLPENFQYPFLASSPQDFWNRWHITLSHWMRDMVFFRFLRFLVKRFPALPSLAASMASIFLTFTLVGAWHGDQLNWVLYGCYHGFALSTELAYRWCMESYWPDLYDRLLGSRVYRVVITVATFNLVAWGLLLTQPLESAAAILERMTF
jgi:D-alanyl-lipoteichoic acid acyltransferase DltB (MBOAT superfamily)